jgi:NAD(P)-dependent dehydrogenase (short-subunit alcohol dehydrogenase family)
VNMASILGTVGLPGSPAYVAAKHGLVGLTKATALEYAAQQVRVNSIGPGLIDTPLLAAISPDMLEQLTTAQPIGRLGRSGEVAELAAFLASDRAGNTTGSYFLTDGGYTAQ